MANKVQKETSSYSMRQRHLWPSVWIVTSKRVLNGQKFLLIPVGRRKNSNSLLPSHSNVNLFFVRSYKEVLMHARMKEIMDHKLSEVENLKKKRVVYQ